MTETDELQKELGKCRVLINTPKWNEAYGNVIVEALAQTAGIIVSESLTEYDKKSVLFMSIHKAKFRKPVIPNDKIIFEVNFINKVKNVYKFFGIASKEKIKVSEAEFSAMITYAK